MKHGKKIGFAAAACIAATTVVASPAALAAKGTPPFIGESSSVTYGSQEGPEDVPVAGIVTGIDTEGWSVSRSRGDGSYAYAIKLGDDRKSAFWKDVYAAADQVPNTETTATVCDLYINGKRASFLSSPFDSFSCEDGGSSIRHATSGKYEVKMKVVEAQRTTQGDGTSTSYGATIDGSEKTVLSFDVNLPSATPPAYAPSPCAVIGGSITRGKATSRGVTYTGVVKHSGNCNTSAGTLNLGGYSTPGGDFGFGGYDNIRQKKHTATSTSFTFTRANGSISKGSKVYVAFTPKAPETRDSSSSLSVN